MPPSEGAGSMYPTPPFRLVIVTQAIPSRPEILPFTGAGPGGLFIGDSDTPPLIPVDNDCEVPQTAERHDHFPFLRC
jgi:hypothetical protein